jgi:hypothetical protein
VGEVEKLPGESAGFPSFFVEIRFWHQFPVDLDIPAYLATRHNEWLHDDPSLETDRTEGATNFIPRDMPVPWWLAVVFPDMEVAQVDTRGLNRCRDRIFFYVHMIRIE